MSTGSDGVLLLTYDDYPVRIEHCHDNIIQFNISTSEFLKAFLAKNHDIIPEYYGGLAKPCKCNKNPLEMAKAKFHKKGCYFNYWNRNVYRWIHKLAALNYAYQMYETIVWLDCDTFFQKYVSKEFILDSFKGTKTFYFKGPRREVEETGIVGYRSKKFIEAYIEKYRSGEFRKYVRWDDCYLYQMTRRDTRIEANDLGKHCVTTDPIPESFFGQYISHKKGTHGRSGLVL